MDYRQSRHNEDCAQGIWRSQPQELLWQLCFPSWLLGELGCADVAQLAQTGAEAVHRRHGSCYSTARSRSDQTDESNG